MNAFLKKILIILFYCFTNDAKCQFFNNVYGGEPSFANMACESVELDDGYLILGQQASYTSRKITFSKLNMKGDTVWKKYYYDDSKLFWGNRIIKAENGFYVGGSVKDSVNSNNSDLFFAYFDENFQMIWLHRYGSDTRFDGFRDMTETKDGGFVLTGQRDYSQYGDYNSQFYAIKVDSLGNLIWENSYGGPSIDNPNDISQTSDGGFIISGYTFIPPTNSSHGHYDFQLVKIDSIGTLEWKKKYGNERNEHGGFVQELPDKSFLAATAFADLYSSAIATLLKIDFNGSVIKQKSFHYGIRTSFNTPIIVLDDGCAAIGRGVLTDESIDKSTILKVSPMLDKIWIREYTRPSGKDLYTFNIKLTNDDGYIFSGTARDSSNIQCSMVIKTDCFGCDSLLCYYADSICDWYDCTQYPISAYFTSDKDTVDLSDNGKITFTNHFQNTTNRYWNFGDGTVSYTGGNKEHIYTAPGDYTVQLIVYHGVCVDTFATTVTVTNNIGIRRSDFSILNISVQPNPANENVIIKWQSTFNQTELSIFNLSGKKITGIPISNYQNSEVVDVKGMSNGIYFVQLMNNNSAIGRSRFVVLKK